MPTTATYEAEEITTDEEQANDVQGPVTISAAKTAGYRRIAISSSCGGIVIVVRRRAREVLRRRATTTQYPTKPPIRPMKKIRTKTATIAVSQWQPEVPPLGPVSGPAGTTSAVDGTNDAAVAIVAAMRTTTPPHVVAITIDVTATIMTRTDRRCDNAVAITFRTTPSDD